MNPKLLEILEHFHKNPGITTADVEKALRESGLNLSEDYLEIQSFMHGGEGFAGDEYVRLYPLERLAVLNTKLGVNEFAPGLVIFGSDGGGTAWVFDNREESSKVGQVPFIPMDFKYLTICGESISDVIMEMSKGQQHNQEPGLIEKEIHEITPVVFGGDPVDPSNKVALSFDEYAEYVVWWNRKYLTMETG